MIEHGRAHGFGWEKSVVILTSNVATKLSMQVAKDRAEVCGSALPCHSNTLAALHIEPWCKMYRLFHYL
jgi:hypothetical protein